MKSTAWLAITLVAWATIILSHNPHMILAAAAFALIALAATSHRLFTTLQHSPTQSRPIALTILALAWLAALAILHHRLAHP